MSHQLHSGELTPAEALEAARKLGRDTEDSGGLDTSYDGGREIVREYVDSLEPGAVVHARARRVLVETGRRKARSRAEAGDTQAVGRTLAAMARDVTPEGYLPHVDVSKWREVTEGGPTTWTIEVGRDE